MYAKKQNFVHKKAHLRSMVCAYTISNNGFVDQKPLCAYETSDVELHFGMNSLKKLLSRVK